MYRFSQNLNERRRKEAEKLAPKPTCDQSATVTTNDPVTVQAKNPSDTTTTMSNATKSESVKGKTSPTEIKEESAMPKITSVQPGFVVVFWYVETCLFFK